MNCISVFKVGVWCFVTFEAGGDEDGCICGLALMNGVVCGMWFVEGVVGIDGGLHVNQIYGGPNGGVWNAGDGWMLMVYIQLADCWGSCMVLPLVDSDSGDVVVL